MAMKGSNAILKKGTSAGGTMIAAMRTVSIALDGEPVDVTSADSTGKWRELLPGAGIQSADITLAGVLKDDATHTALVNDRIAQTVDAYGLVVSTFGTFDGNWLIGNVEFTGEHNGELQYSVRLLSSGPITFAAVA